MNATLNTALRPAIHLDVTQPADLVILPTDGQNNGEEGSADFGFEIEPHWSSQARRKRSSRHSTKHDHPSKRSRNWLHGDPFAWRGRKVRHRKTRVIYTVRQVFKSGRVELQKSFMSYLTNVRTVQKDYETYY